MLTLNLAMITDRHRGRDRNQSWWSPCSWLSSLSWWRPLSWSWAWHRERDPVTVFDRDRDRDLEYDVSCGHTWHCYRGRDRDRNLDRECGVSCGRYGDFPVNDRESSYWSSSWSRSDRGRDGEHYSTILAGPVEQSTTWPTMHHLTGNLTSEFLSATITRRE